MRFDLSLWCTKIDTLTFSNLANVQTVGIGLYLALAIVQAVSTTGVAGLRRRLTTLQAAVKSAKMASEVVAIEAIFQEIGHLEIGFHAFNRTLLWLVTALFAVSVGYFTYCSIWSNLLAERRGFVFIISFYICLPPLLFAAAAGIIARKCKKTEGEIKSAERRYRAARLG